MIAIYEAPGAESFRTLDILVRRGVPLNHLTKVNWEDLSPKLKKVYSKRDALFRNAREICVEFRGFKITARPGFISDLATVPWWLRVIGISRFTRTGWMDLGAILHDGIYRGAARFTRDDRENKAMADALLLACWIWAGGNRREVWRNYYAMRYFGWPNYKPRPEMHADGIMTIEPIMAVL